MAQFLVSTHIAPPATTLAQPAPLRGSAAPPRWRDQPATGAERVRYIGEVAREVCNLATVRPDATMNLSEETGYGYWSLAAMSEDARENSAAARFCPVELSSK
jgi:hypothetical protein